MVEDLVLARNPDRLPAYGGGKRAYRGERPFLALDEDVGLGQNGNACVYIGERLEGVKGAQEGALFVQWAKLFESMGAARVEKDFSRRAPRLTKRPSATLPISLSWVVTAITSAFSTTRMFSSV